MRSSRSRKLLLALLAGGLLVVVCGAGAMAFFNVAKAVSGMVITESAPLSNRIAFVGNDGNLWLAAPGKDELDSVAAGARGYQLPTWAPDSRSLAFIGPGDEGNAALFVAEGVRGEPEVLFSKPGSAPFYIYWSPDSRSVTFLTQEASSLAMRLADAENPGDDRIMAKGAPFYWVWSPSGDQLLMHVGGARAFSKDAHLSFLDNRDGAHRVELKCAPGQFQAPIWSASGEYVFYIGAGNTGGQAIYKTHMGTSRQTLIVLLSGPAYMALSPDDRHIAYLDVQSTAQFPALGTAYIVDTEGRNKRQVLKDWVAAMYWSPDGKKLALLTPAEDDAGPTARAHGLAAPLSVHSRYRWWVYYVETEALELLTSYVPTLEFLQTVPYFDQYHLSLTFWSPDSRYLVITRRMPQSRDGTVWILDTTGQESPHQVGEGTFAVWSWQ